MKFVDIDGFEVFPTKHIETYTITGVTSVDQAVLVANNRARSGGKGAEYISSMEAVWNKDDVKAVALSFRMRCSKYKVLYYAQMSN